VLSRLATTIANFEMPEPYDAKVSCPVLRGFTLPDTAIVHNRKAIVETEKRKSRMLVKFIL